MDCVDLIKSVSGLLKLARDGVVALKNSYVDIDGEMEVTHGKQITCSKITLIGLVLIFCWNRLNDPGLVT